MHPKRVYFPGWLSGWGPVLLWLAVIFAFSANSDPYRALPSGWEATCQTFHFGSLCQDEMVGRVSHASEYAILALLVCRAWLAGRAATAPGLLAAGGLSYALALLDELHQLFVPGRTFQLLDLGLDGLGILLGLSIYVLAGLIHRRRRAWVKTTW